jgi:hypothetical protein
MNKIPKSEHNACPICGLPRGKGQHEFAHGKCMELRATTDGKELAHPNHPTMGRITVDHQNNGKRRAAKSRYLSGKLPKWMYD